MHLFTGSRSELVSSKISVARKELFFVLKNAKFYRQCSYKCNERLMDYIKEKFCEHELSKDSENKLKVLTRVFVSKLLTKWKQSKQIEERFMKNHFLWIEGKLNILHLISAISAADTSSVKAKQGRPKKIFAAKSQRSKQREIRPVLSSLTSEKLGYAVNQNPV